MPRVATGARPLTDGIVGTGPPHVRRAGRGRPARHGPHQGRTTAPDQRAGEDPPVSERPWRGCRRHAVRLPAAPVAAPFRGPGTRFRREFPADPPPRLDVPELVMARCAEHTHLAAPPATHRTPHSPEDATARRGPLLAGRCCCAVALSPFRHVVPSPPGSRTIRNARYEPRENAHSRKERKGSPPGRTRDIGASRRARTDGFASPPGPQ